MVVINNVLSIKFCKEAKVRRTCLSQDVAQGIELKEEVGHGVFGENFKF